VYADNTPITNALGNQIRMTAHQAFVGINTLRMKMGDPILNVPVQGAAPVPLLTTVLSADIGAGAFQLVFTATPLAAGTRIYGRGWVEDSVGVNYVKNKLVYFGYSGAAQASPWNLEADFGMKFGTVSVGQVVWVESRVYAHVTGLLSAPMLATATVVTT
jgi:hypothetical protein